MGLPEIILLFLTGSLAGFAGGLLGIGGGIFYVLVLQFFFEVFSFSALDFPRYVIANSIFTTFFTALAGSVPQLRLKNFFLRESFFVSVSSLASALFISFLITHTGWYVKEKFLIVYVLIIVLVIIQMIGKEISFEKENNTPSLYSYLTAGFAGGILAGLTGMGGGILVIPVLYRFFRIPLKKVISVSLVSIMFSSAGNIFWYFLHGPAVKIGILQAGYVYFPVCIPLVAGAVFSAPAGVRLTHKLPVRTIRNIFACFLLFIILKTLVFDLSHLIPWH